tara:strand:- start:234550 stop:234765 length:216 start_codon:yes stop_codon:yes gene_type:complete
MDKFEETVVNPNIALNNFEVKIREHEEKPTHAAESNAVKNTPAKHAKTNYKTLLLLVTLVTVLIYQVTVIL